MFPGFSLFGYFLSSYAICAIVGIFAACPISVYFFKKRADDKNADISLIFVFLFAALGTFLGMHLLYAITNIAYWGSFGKARTSSR